MLSSPRCRLTALFAGLAVLLLSGLLPGSGALAQSSGVYTSPPVPIEAKSDSPARARQAALDQGQAKALQALLESLTAPQDHARLPRIDAARAGALIRDFSIADERTTANSYMATLTARFDTATVNTILNAAGVPYSLPRTEPVLVVPVYSPSQGSSSVLLWEDTNPWAQEWTKRTAQPGGQVPVVLALGDVEDLDLLSARTAADAVRTRTAPQDAVRELALRNGAPDAVVVLAEGTPETGLEVTPMGVGVFERLAPFSVPPRPDAFDYAISRVRSELDDSWKSQGRPADGGYGSPGSAGSWTGASAGAGAGAPGGSGAYPAEAGADPSTLPPGWMRSGPEGAQGGYGTVDPATGQPGAWDQAGDTAPWAGAPLTVIARFDTLNDWVSIRKRLQGLPGVSEMTLQAVSRNQAQMSLRFGGDPDRLRAILATRGLDLSRGDDVWYVDSTGPGRPPDMDGFGTPPAAGYPGAPANPGLDTGPSSEAARPGQPFLP
ncbi:DUF2066 domain-containing protein [Phaeovibrio sulfidiphilus]|uniref:DUF2066 domain-containing protein n=1 Tax=Phaeovibrio sulfidiphilus TaxID=1220600 RepID=A0A8J7CE16_9PROT|nr:DUF2066 domain-containing protein [Phaeovibrio sulfidiphilus]MBE1237459.1 DUF2066 domain-containing protein [Phaeovibrio sulfidiphilus]